MDLNRVVEKLILHPFLFHGNGQLKQFIQLNYGIFQQL
ncbi:hypothetical protein LEP1GSC172_1583 [Leptospira noguchii]|uniref:Uncharacterized protein n=1 Tax=Leptospira noguchii TaxID=28182 RepID=M6VL98_9LEPT|nr:hypothetical protein LEP1GSC172_1583 [Leptospira noguchii]